MRTTRAVKNLTGGLSDDEKSDIFQNKDSEIRRLLNIDKAIDKNEQIDVIQNKNKKIKKIHHAKVATDFIDHDFVIN